MRCAHPGHHPHPDPLAARRKDLPDVVAGRLQQIDGECSEQIDRFGLIFQAAEWQRKPEETQLARTNLGTILKTLNRLGESNSTDGESPFNWTSKTSCRKC